MKQLIGYIYDAEGRYSYQIRFEYSIENIANFIFQVKNSSKTIITNTSDQTLVEYRRNMLEYTLAYDRALEELRVKSDEYFDDIIKPTAIKGLSIEHDPYDTDFLIDKMNERFGVEIMKVKNI